MNRTLTLLAAKAALGTSLVAGLALAPHGVAHADDVDADDGTSYVNLTDLPGIDSVPKCTVEDGSDALLPCVWHSKAGDDYLTFADRSYLIVDNTVTAR